MALPSASKPSASKKSAYLAWISAEAVLQGPGISSLAAALALPLPGGKNCTSKAVQLSLLPFSTTCEIKSLQMAPPSAWPEGAFFNLAEMKS